MYIPSHPLCAAPSCLWRAAAATPQRHTCAPPRASRPPLHSFLATQRARQPGLACHLVRPSLCTPLALQKQRQRGPRRHPIQPPRRRHTPVHTPSSAGCLPPAPPPPYPSRPRAQQAAALPLPPLQPARQRLRVAHAARPPCTAPCSSRAGRAEPPALSRAFCPATPPTCLPQHLPYPSYMMLPRVAFAGWNTPAELRGPPLYIRPRPHAPRRCDMRRRTRRSLALHSARRATLGAPLPFAVGLAGRTMRVAPRVRGRRWHSHSSSRVPAARPRPCVTERPSAS